MNYFEYTEKHNKKIPRSLIRHLVYPSPTFAGDGDVNTTVVFPASLELVLQQGNGYPCNRKCTHCFLMTLVSHDLLKHFYAVEYFYYFPF